MRTLRESFRDAAAGLSYVWLTERNMRIHTAAGALAIAAAILGGVPLSRVLFVVSAILVVILSELINTALESLVDLSTAEYHPLAARCKDIAAGAVLVSALYAILVGLAVFLPDMHSIVDNIYAAVKHRPLLTGLFAAAVAMLWYEALTRG